MVKLVFASIAIAEVHLTCLAVAYQVVTEGGINLSYLAVTEEGIIRACLVDQVVTEVGIDRV